MALITPKAALVWGSVILGSMMLYSKTNSPPARIVGGLLTFGGTTAIILANVNRDPIS